MLIKDPNYQLPVIHAQNPYNVFYSGTNTPLVIRGVNEYSNQKMDAVVKFQAAERMSPEANMRELLAAFIAKEWDLSVVEPALIYVAEPFVKLLKGRSVYSIASKSMGLNVGSILERGKRPISIFEPLTEEQKKQAKQIFCFDAFISNPDRSMEKPNMMTDGEVITIFDHEIAFSFVFDIIKNKTPYKFRQNDINTLEEHCLYHKIKGEVFSDEFLRSKLDALDADFWNKAKSLIPDDWLSEQFDEIYDYLNTVIAQKEQFITEIKRVLL
jgi:hypothetical protein